jgi:hypothetical protein
MKSTKQIQLDESESKANESVLLKEMIPHVKCEFKGSTSFHSHTLYSGLKKDKI